MTGLNRALFAIALAAVVAGGAAAALIVSSDHTPMPGAGIVIGLLISWSFVGTGLYAWWRRPASRFGALMTAVGFTYMLGALTASDDSVVFTIGVMLASLYFVVFAHMLLAYPDGRLERPWHAWLLAAGYVLTLVGSLPQLLWGFTERMADSCPDCPESALLIERNDTLRDVFNGLISVIGVALVAVVLVILIRRWRAATAPQRRAMAPILWSGVAMLVLVGSSLGSDAAGISRLTDVLGWAGLLVFASVPYVFLIGLVRSRVARAGAVSELLLRLGEAPGTGTLRCRLADALGDRSLQLVFWLEDKSRWVDSDGHVVQPPADDDLARAWTAVELEGRRVGAIVHDRTLCEEPELLGSVAAAAGLAMENERLQAQLRARVEELRTSRARIVEAGTDERRRLERNLHDGAQQRLVALSLTLRLAQGKVHAGPRAGERAARRRPAGADAGARRAARAGARHPPGRAVRPRTRRRAGSARRARADRGRPRRAARRPAARADRGGRLLRDRRGADQRRQVRPCQPGHRARGAPQRTRHRGGRRRRHRGRRPRPRVGPAGTRRSCLRARRAHVARLSRRGGH